MEDADTHEFLRQAEKESQREDQVALGHPPGGDWSSRPRNDAGRAAQACPANTLGFWKRYGCGIGRRASKKKTQDKPGRGIEPPGGAEMGFLRRLIPNQRLGERQFGAGGDG